MRTNVEIEIQRLDTVSRTRALSEEESDRLITLMRSHDRARIRAQAPPPPSRRANG